MPLPETFHELLEFSILASQTDPFDPMEKAIHGSANNIWPTPNISTVTGSSYMNTRCPQAARSLAGMERRDGEEYVVAAKGAPEAIADLCHLDEHRLAHTFCAGKPRMAEQGLRVLGVAKASYSGSEWPEDPA